MIDRRDGHESIRHVEPGHEGRLLSCATPTRRDLIDEYRLCVNPLVPGRGNPLFKPVPDRKRMRLLEARPLRSGCVILRYEPQAKPH
jgi:hypothetical protein